MPEKINPGDALAAVLSALIRALEDDALEPDAEEDLSRTLEPLAVCEDGRGARVYRFTGEGRDEHAVAVFGNPDGLSSWRPELFKGDAERHALCVNLLRGIPTRVIRRAVMERPNVEIIHTKGGE